jgi:hypothetical protein
VLWGNPVPPSQTQFGAQAWLLQLAQTLGQSLNDGTGLTRSGVQQRLVSLHTGLGLSSPFQLAELLDELFGPLGPWIQPHERTATRSSSFNS